MSSAAVRYGVPVRRVAVHSTTNWLGLECLPALPPLCSTPGTANASNFTATLHHDQDRDRDWPRVGSCPKGTGRRREHTACWRSSRVLNSFAIESLQFRLNPYTGTPPGLWNSTQTEQVAGGESSNNITRITMLSTRQGCEQPSWPSSSKSLLHWPEWHGQAQALLSAWQYISLSRPVLKWVPLWLACHLVNFRRVGDLSGGKPMVSS
jgi:hypothetical protein